MTEETAEELHQQFLREHNCKHWRKFLGKTKIIREGDGFVLEVNLLLNLPRTPNGLMLPETWRELPIRILPPKET